MRIMCIKYCCFASYMPMYRFLCIDSLPTYSNLSRWGKRLSNKCPFCPNTTGTLHHILAHCPSLLERYTWRHNNVLKAILTTITTTGTGNFNVYCDIGGQTIAGGTIPPHILVTNKSPDLVIVWEDPKQILLIELTVPFESNITDAHKRKIDRYKALVQDLNETRLWHNIRSHRGLTERVHWQRKQNTNKTNPCKVWV